MASNKNACNLRMGGYISNILFIILSLRNVTGNLSQYYLSIIQESDRSITSYSRFSFGITLQKTIYFQNLNPFLTYPIYNYFIVQFLSIDIIPLVSKYNENKVSFRCHEVAKTSKNILELLYVYRYVLDLSKKILPVTIGQRATKL